MHIVGIDLSGPSNIVDTVAVVYRVSESGLFHHLTLEGAGDEAIIDLVARLLDEGPVAVGLDAPLSYNPGGGHRQSDKELRKLTSAAGMKPGSVMPPTLNRMIYLTARGISIARALESLSGNRLKIVEVHPGATLALRGALISSVLSMKSEIDSRRELVRWLDSQNVPEVTEMKNPTDHYVAACAAALSAWKWSNNEAVWIHPARPPLHPYDFAA